MGFVVEKGLASGRFLTRRMRGLTIGAMKSRILFPLVALLIVGTGQGSASAQEKKAKGPEQFQSQIAAYEAQDRENPPPKGQILFTGTSTIRRWTTLAQDFPEHKVINRGFGGSQFLMPRTSPIGLFFRISRGPFSFALAATT